MTERLVSISLLLWDIKATFNVSHELSNLLTQLLSEEFKKLELPYALNLLIGCSSNNPDEVKIGKVINHRGYPKEITQEVFFPAAKITSMDAFVFHLKKFDFIFKKDAIRVYPEKDFVEDVILAFQLFIEKQRLSSQPNYDLIRGEAFKQLETNPGKFKFKSKEIRLLESIIKKDHFAFTDPEEADWLETEIGKKWLALADKYEVVEDGTLIQKL